MAKSEREKAREKALAALDELTQWSRAVCEKILDNPIVRKYFAEVMRERCQACYGGDIKTLISCTKMDHIENYYDRELTDLRETCKEE